MKERIENIGQLLLEDMYKHGFSSFYSKNLLELFPNQNERDIKDSINLLYSKGLIKVFGIDHITFNFFLRDFSGYITDIGVINIEEKDFYDESKYSIEIIRFIQVIDESSEQTIYVDRIIPLIKQKGSKKTEQELALFLSTTIEHTCNVQKKWSGGERNYSNLYIVNSTSPITNLGMELFQEYIKETTILTSSIISNRDMIMKEYNSLMISIKNHLWKDACIKMGSILEYLLTKWLGGKNINQISHSGLNKPKSLDKSWFHDKLMYYIEIGRINYNNQIGDRTQWEIVDKVIRDYRNYIHLQEYEKKLAIDGYLEKNDYELLFKPFNQILGYFK